MKFTDIFIRRPVLAVSISLLLLILGLQAISKLQVREYPELTNTTITVSTAYYGAPAEVIQGFITQPLQQAIAESDNLDYLESKSQMGSSTITAYMKIGADSDAALSEIMSKVNSVRARLPKEALDPSVSRSTGSSTSIMYISFSSDSLNQAQIADYLKRTAQPKMVTVAGVSKANVWGPELSIRVWLDPNKLAAHNLSAAEVTNALQANNFRAAPGQVKSRFKAINVEANTSLVSKHEFEQLIVASRPQGIVRLSDIAEVEIGALRETVKARSDGSNSIMMAIDPTPTANPLTVAKAVRDMLPEVENSLPDNIKMLLVYDSTEYIESSINEVLFTILEATFIVVVVIFFFMGSLRAVIIPVIAIPLSLVGVCLAMQMLGFSINLLTLLAMVLAIGLVVDDAIVVVENIDRHLRQGASPFNAAIAGTREIAVPVISMTVTLAAVYSPIALLGGLTGALFKEFALTLAGAVVVSGIVALTLSPMMCAQILKSSQGEHNKLEQGIHHFLDRLDHYYLKMLDGTLRHRGAVILFSLVVMASLYPLFSISKQELAPAEDKGAAMMIANAPPSVNVDYLDAYSQEISKRGLAHNDVAGTIMISGVPSNTQSLGIFRMELWQDRTQSLEQTMKDLKAATQDIAGVNAIAFPMAVLPGAGGGFPIQFVIKGVSDYETLQALAQNIQQQAMASGLLVFSDLDLKFETGRLSISVNHDKAGAYGVTMQDIASTLASLMGDGYINHVNIDGRSYEVVPQVARKDRLTPEKLDQYYVRTPKGAAVPLSNLIDFKINGEPAALVQMDQANAVTLSAVLMPGKTMGEAITFLQQTADEVLPRGFEIDFKGESRQYIQEGSALYMTFVLALAIIFLVLAAQFESWKDPLVIMFTVPLAICGALLVMGWGISSMNIYTQIGLITLVGLITKHGILMCEVAKEQQIQHGENRTQAIRVAAKIRLRAILMTTISMVAGLVPLLLATGPGAAARFDIGIIICAGLSIGTLFTLFVLPTIYTFMGAKHKPLPTVPH